MSPYGKPTEQEVAFVDEHIMPYLTGKTLDEVERITLVLRWRLDKLRNTVGAMSITFLCSREVPPKTPDESPLSPANDDPSMLQNIVEAIRLADIGIRRADAGISEIKLQMEDVGDLRFAELLNADLNLLKGHKRLWEIMKQKAELLAAIRQLERINRAHTP